jgi:hypothetical protein
MAYAQSSTEGGFKCGKCRTTLLTDNNGQMLLLSSDSTENSKLSVVPQENTTALWHLQTDSLPDWVTESINQVLQRMNY